MADFDNFHVYPCGYTDDGGQIHGITATTSDGGGEYPQLRDTVLADGRKDIIEVASGESRDGWLKKLGYLIAEYHAESLGWDFNGNSKDSRLTDFPKGYELFVHKRGQRTDLYLYGSVHHKKFRSAQEFHPHLYWLLAGMPHKSTPQEPDCECHYCSGTKQKEISAKYPLYTKGPSQPSNDPVVNKTCIPRHHRGPGERIVHMTRNSLTSTYHKPIYIPNHN